MPATKNTKLRGNAVRRKTMSPGASQALLRILNHLHGDSPTYGVQCDSGWKGPSTVVIPARLRSSVSRALAAF